MPAETPAPKFRTGSVRLTHQTRADVDFLAAELGLTYNAAMNLLVRAGLRAVRENGYAALNDQK